jgi:8-oxo-dGTP pyrophosphatase MutT (NUDIX family)
VAVLDAVTNLVIGVAEKRDAHARGQLHGSVLLLARPEPGKLLVYVRHEHQSFPGCFDIFGGHGQPSDAADPRATALREAREELRIFDVGGLQVMLMEDWLVPLGDRHELESGDPHNRERSTAFGLALPPGVTARAFDETDDGREVELRVEAMTIDQVLHLRRESPTRIADGLSRLLDHMDGDRDFTAQVQSFVQGGSQ